MIVRNITVCSMLLVLIGAAGCSASGLGRHYPSPEAAVDSLVAALRTNNTAELKSIFGPSGDQIISSGDPVADKAQVDHFLTNYDAKHQFQTQPDGSTTLLIGDQDWPFPVPIVKVDGGVAFNAAAGEEEILNRRVGRNELATEQVCLAIVDAQRDYAQMRPMGGALREYAQKLVSDPGKKNGLYWPTNEGEPPSPMGPLIANAAAEGYGKAGDDKAGDDKSGNDKPGQRPYHGYYYRLLTSQGPNATGGAEDYMVNGQLIGGFAIVAYPAIYGNSGVMTFMTNHDGILYERDLGEDTTRLAKAITAFDPGPEWKRSDVDADAAAAAAHADDPAGK